MFVYIYIYIYIYIYVFIIYVVWGITNQVCSIVVVSSVFDVAWLVCVAVAGCRVLSLFWV